jgi:hypothetical protein
MVADGRVVQSSRQPKEHLLCSGSEQKFGVAENYASRLAYDGPVTAPIFDRLLRLDYEPTGHLIAARPVGLDTDKLCYFAASVFWRAHVSRLMPKCSLGSYAESFRRYLSGETAFPEQAALLLLVYEDAPGEGSRVARFECSPVSERHRQCHVHWFTVCGLHFELAVGSVIPEHFLENRLVRSSDKLVFIARSDLALERIGDSLRNASRSRHLSYGTARKTRSG